MVEITIYKNSYAKAPNIITLDYALERIKSCHSQKKIDDIRNEMDDERRSSKKKNLPSVCFHGKFKGRSDSDLIKHSGFITLDFDHVDDIEKTKQELQANEYIYACWISPSGDGLKALVKVADGKKHRNHFKALQELFPTIDSQCINVGRLCFESADSTLYVNKKAKLFTEIITEEKIVEVNKTENSADIFTKIMKWLTNKGDAFVKGERNTFVFKLASACCRFGINESECGSFCSLTINDGDFSDTELRRTIKSAYKSNESTFGTAEFTNDRLVDKKTKSEVDTTEIEPDIYNMEIKPKDVIYGEEVKGGAVKIYEEGYEKVDGLGVDELDSHFKMKRKEVTLLSGIGNYGKSSFMKWYILMRIVLFKDKFALFAPEDNPAEEFYHDMVEILLGCNCTPSNPDRPPKAEYEKAYDYISQHFFYVYPETISPTPDYIKERFLELIIKEKINGCVIDPFNQMTNNYRESGGRSDKYLETLLSDFLRFAQTNNIYFFIIAHPVKLYKPKGEVSYPCPDVFDVADGAMWNNKCDNILIYHRPDHQENPNGTDCELHTKKIRRQKIVGKKGIVTFDLNRSTRRFYFNGRDPLREALTGEKDSTVRITPPPEDYNANKTVEAARNEDDWMEEIEEVDF